MLSAAQMARMLRLLDEALDLDRAEQRRWLQGLAAEHPDLEPVLRQMLLREEHRGTGADPLAPMPRGGGDHPFRSGLGVGELVGPYRLIRELGSGGMAKVWLAQRADGAFKRELALKVPLLGRLRRDLSSRFAHERDILAGLEHPNIARMYDAGVSADGLPYLAMEYVRGEQLLTWCDANRLTLDYRLGLLLQILDAVRYAHERLVIHRDLKPSNILVTAEGHVRLLDFGVAKLLAGDDDEQAQRTDLTQAYGPALTPDYASPEMLAGERVDAASDVYSLGVVSYELLTGRPPYRLEAGVALAQLRQALAGVRIEKPSDVISPDAALARRTEPEELAQRLRKWDLDSIVLKALAQQPHERYPDAAALARDLLVRLFGQEPGWQPPDWMRRWSSSIPSAAPSIPVDDESIAVLPFLDLSEAKDQEYFSDGLSEALIDQLSKRPPLRVIARTSSFQFKGRSDDVRAIAQKLGVAHLLEGSVRKASTALRITTRLIRAADGVSLWSETYERHLNDIFEVQDQISSAVACALDVTLCRAISSRDQDGAVRQTRAVNVEAYNRLLQGNYFLNRNTQADTEKAIEFYREAIELSPDYALAWVSLAQSNMRQAVSAWTSKVEADGRARDALQRALSIDPRLGFAHRIFAHLLEGYWDWAEATSEYRFAVELDPTDLRARGALARLKAFKSGQHDESISFLRQSLLQDPLDTVAHWSLGRTLGMVGQLEESETALRKLLELSPSFAGGPAMLSMALLVMNRPSDALTEANKETDESWRLCSLPVIYWALGRSSESDAALIELERRFAADCAYNIAQAHAYRNAVDAAFEWLDLAARQRDAAMPWIKVDPLIRGLRTDPRYQALLVRMKLAD